MRRSSALTPLLRGMVLAAALTVCSVPTGMAAEGTVTGVRVGHHDGFSRLTITFSEAIRFRAAMVGDPYRLVLELNAVEWLLAPEIALGDGLVERVAFRGERDRSQIVATLRGPARVQKTFALRPRTQAGSWRLVIDLERISRDAFERLYGARTGPPAPTGSVVAAAWRVAPPVVRSRAMGPTLVADGERAPLVVIDPGHGGEDVGAVSPWGLQEKEVVLRFSRMLEAALRERGGYRVRLTRTGDRYLPLEKRFEIARAARADLFLSIHADANPIRRLRGLSVYTLSAGASDRMARELAHRENRSGPIAGVDLENKSDPVSGILIDLLRRETMARSVRFAKLVVEEAGEATRLLHKPRRSAGFVVLKAPEVPSVLVELGILTNRSDERKLRRPAHLRKVAAALARAVSRYFAGRRKADRSGQDSAAD